MQKICTLENLNIDEVSLQYLLNKLDIDFRQIIIALCYIKTYVGKNKEIGIDQINEILPYIFKKDVDYTIISAASKLLNTNVDISNITPYFDIDQSVIPLVIHENICTVFHKKTDPVIVDYIDNYYDNIIMGDIFNSYAHNNISWSHNDYYGILNCYIPGSSNKNKKTPTGNKIHTKVSNIKYTNFFSKNAHLFYNINTKIQLCQKIQITDTFFNYLIDTIVFHFYNNLPFSDEIIHIFRSSNISIIDIEKMVKLSIYKDIYEKNNKDIKKKINVYLKQIKY